MIDSWTKHYGPEVQETHCESMEVVSGHCNLVAGFLCVYKQVSFHVSTSRLVDPFVLQI